jgi:RNA polymerase sigma factor (sigma-70 family)
MSGASASLLRHIQHLVDVHQSTSLSDRQLLERFAVQRDEMAFEVLVRRHGPMVLSVCRRVLGHEQDAEDVFQAAFLILARKGGEIRKKDVGSFLYRVAYRLAVRAHGQKVNRLNREQRYESVLAPDPLSEVTWREVRQVVDEETQRLPERLRSPLVLCYREGKAQQEAARLLGWSKSTLRRSLNHGCELLRRRLLARGLAPMAALTASLFAEEAASAMPATLVSATVRAAGAGSVSPAIVALVEAGVALVAFSKAKVAMVLLLTMSLLGGASLWSSATPQVAVLPRAQSPVAKADDKKAAPPKPAAAKTVEIQAAFSNPLGNRRRGQSSCCSARTRRSRSWASRKWTDGLPSPCPNRRRAGSSRGRRMPASTSFPPPNWSPKNLWSCVW